MTPKLLFLIIWIPALVSAAISLTIYACRGNKKNESNAPLWGYGSGLSPIEKSLKSSNHD